MKTARMLIPAVVLYLAGSGLGGTSWGSASAQTVFVAEAAVREIVLTGFTRARARLPLIAETQGRIEEVRYDIGDTIGADGIFARVDETFLRLELEENAAQQVQLRQRLAFDEREVERYRALARKSNAAAAQLDSVQQTRDNNAQALRLLEIRGHTLAERLARTRIPAPPGWRVTARMVEPGQWVNYGNRLAEVADFSVLLIPFALTPEQLAALQAHAEALTAELPDLGQQVPLAIHRINPDFDADTRKIAVDLRLAAPLAEPRGGLRAVLRLPLPEAAGAVWLPAAAVRSSFEEYWVQPLEGAPFPVVVLGRVNRPEGEYLRLSSPRIAPGDRFVPPRLPGDQP